MRVEYHPKYGFRYLDDVEYDVSPNDVLVEMVYSGLCASDIH